MKKYGFWNFILDLILVGLTGGIWLIWIFIREMRRNNRCEHPRYDRRYDNRY